MHLEMHPGNRTPKKAPMKTPINEADLSVPEIDRDTAAALMQPLTDLVIRAGAAILAVNRLAMRVDGKQDGSPVTEADHAAVSRSDGVRTNPEICRGCSGRWPNHQG